MPANEVVQATGAGDEIAAGPEEQVVGVPEDDLGTRIKKVPVQRRLDGPLRAHRHEGGRLDCAMRGMQPSPARAGLWASGKEFELEQN